MARTRILSLSVALVGAIAAVLTARQASAADRGVLVRDRDRLTATIDVGDEDAFDFDLAEGGRLNFSVAAVRGAELRPSMRLFEPDGTEFDLASITIRAGASAPRVRTIVVPEGTTGRWQLRVSGGGTTGGYVLSAHVSAPKIVRKRRLAVPAGESVDVPFAGDTNALVKCVIRAFKKTSVLPGQVRLLAPDGLDAPGSSGIFATTRGVMATKFVLGQGFGRYAFVLEPAPQGAATVDVLVSVRFAHTRARRDTLASELRVDSVGPAQIRQEDSALALTVTGTGLIQGSTATIGGAGATVASVDVADDGLSATLVVDVAADAPYGDRRLVIFPPELLGESVAVADAVTVLAPNPTVTGVSLGTGEQGDQGLVLEATGTGFRAGGVIGVSGVGVTIGDTEIVSDVLARATIAIAADAPVGLRDVMFTQPAEGGGATATLPAAFDVTLPGPMFTSISPATLEPADAHMLLRIVGGNFNAGTTTSFSGTGLTVHSTTFVDAATLDVDVSASSDAAPGPRNVTITPAPGAGPAHRFLNKLTVVATGPVVTRFSHATLAQGATSVGVVVSGRNFRAGDTLVADGAGVTFSVATVSGTTQILATATVAPGAATGARSLTVAHAASDGAMSGTLTGAFRVTGAVPTFASVSPSSVGTTGSGGVARTVPLTIAGTNFATGATVSITRAGGAGLTIVAGSAAVVSETRVDVVISLAGDATTGAWNVVVANPGGLGDSGVAGNGALTVQPSTTLAVNRVIASSGGPYGGERVTIQGSGFADGCLVDFGAVRASGTQVIDANTIVTTVPRPASASKSAATSVDVKVTPTVGSAVTLTRGYAYAMDDVRFRAIRVIPAQGATGVAQNLTSAVVVLSAPADTTTGAYGATTGLNTFWYESAGSFVTSGVRGFGPGGRFLVFSRTGGGNLSTVSGGVHVLDIPTALKSLGGNAFAPTRLSASLNHDQQTFTLSTTATDSNAPTLSAAAPSNGSSGQDTTTKVVLSMSEELDPLTVSLSKITFTQGAATVPASLELSDDLRTVTIVPNNELAANTTYAVTITGAVQDLFGNAFTPVTRTFTTGSGTDTTNPSIDAVVIESLPSTLDGTGTYVDAAGVGGRQFDVYLPRSGWRFDVTFSDAGGSGVDETTFSAKCSVPVGANAANAELASNFTVTSAGASWVVPAAAPVTAAENVAFTFTVKDKAGNTSSARVVVVDVADKDATAVLGGDLDPIDSRRTWILRTDMDVFTSTPASTTTPTPRQGAVTSAAANGVSDLDDTLRLVGLGTANMTSEAASTTNGPDTGTNAIVRRLFVERLRELLNERYSIAADGTHGADSVDVEFLLPGEQGSLASVPTYSTANTANSSKPFSEISIGGTFGADAGAYATSSKIGDASYDARNQREEANLNNGAASDTGIFLLGAFKLQVNSNALFMAKISGRLVAVHGGTPVGEDAGDDDVLAGGFDRTTSVDAALNARYDAIMDAVEYAALYASAITAHEIGHSLGLVPDGAPKTGLFGAAHFNNAFTEATSASPNTSHHLDYLGNDLMAAAASFDSTTWTGSDFKRFGPMDIAFLRNRLLHDEGK